MSTATRREPRGLWPLAAGVGATSAVAYVCSDIGWPSFALAWCGLVPFLAAVDSTRSLRAALLCGWLMAVGFVIAVLGWFAAAIQTYTGIPWILALALLVVAAPLLEPQFLTFSLARWYLRSTGPTPNAQLPTVPAIASLLIYVGSEWAFPKLFADTLGHGFLAAPLLRQAADLAGARGLTLVLLLSNQSVWWALGAWRDERRRGWSAVIVPLLVPAILGGVLAAYGTVRIRQLDAGADAKPITFGIVQGNLSHYDALRQELGTYDTVRLILDTYFGMSAELLRQGPVDVLLWPETVYPTTFGKPKSDGGAALDGEIVAFAEHAGVPLIFGAYDTDGVNEFNAAFLLQPAGQASERLQIYRKAAPFPLTERVPAWLESEKLRAWLPWLGTWKAGDGGQAIELRLQDGRRLRVAPLICYDAIFPGLAVAAVNAGAELIVTLSNDSWFASANGPRQHLVVSAFRSLETRRPQVRLTNTGISALITATGEIRDVMQTDRRGSERISVVPTTAWSLTVAWGDWLGPLALVAGVGLLVLWRVKGPRRSAS